MKQEIQQEKKLGRGLSALLGDSKSKNESLTLNRPANSTIEFINIDKIITGIYQRLKFDIVLITLLGTMIVGIGLFAFFMWHLPSQKDFATPVLLTKETFGNVLGNLILFVLIRFFAGVGHAGYPSSTSKSISVNFSKNRRTFIQSLILSTSGIG